jgi:hypothetical protein
MYFGLCILEVETTTQIRVWNFKFEMRIRNRNKQKKTKKERRKLTWTHLGRITSLFGPLTPLLSAQLTFSPAPAHSTLFPFLFRLWRLHVGPLCQPSFFFPWRTEVRWLSAPYSSWIRCNATGGSWDPAVFSGFIRGLFRTATMRLHQKTPLVGGSDERSKQTRKDMETPLMPTPGYATVLSS